MKNSILLKGFLLITIFAGAIYLTYRYSFDEGQKKGKSDGYNIGFKESEILTTKAIYENQRDSLKNVDLSLDNVIDRIDFDEIFKNISVCNDCSNSNRCKRVYKREFASVAQTIILEIGKNKGYSNSQLLAIKKKFDEVKDQISEDAFMHFISLNCNSKSVEVSINRESSNIDSVGNSVVSTYTTSSNFSTSVGTVFCGHFMKSIYGSLCAVVMTQVIAPFDLALKEYAIIEDINKSKSIIEGHLRQNIAELSTVEDEIENSVEVQKKGWFGSTSELYVDIRSNIKAGIDLSKHFIINVDHGMRIIHIEIGDPEILSNETHILNRSIDDGWFTAGFSVNDLEKAEKKGMKLNYTNALNSNILDEATKNTLIILDDIISPMVSNPAYDYELLITTKKGKMVNNNLELVMYDPDFKN